MTKRPPGRVGIVTSSFLPLAGGAERQCLRLARWLQSRDDLAWVLTERINPISPAAEVVDGIRVHRVGAVALWRRLRRAITGSLSDNTTTTYEKLRQRGLMRALHWLKQCAAQVLVSLPAIFFVWRRRESVRALVCFFFSPLEAITCWVARRLGIPVIVRPSNSRQYLFVGLVARWQHESLLAADRIVAISQDIRQQLVQHGVDESRIRVIPNGVDVPVERWDGHAPHRYAAVCVANLSQQPLKGLDVLVEAWALVTRDRGPSRLLLCGRGNPSTLIRLAQRHGVRESVEFAGFVRDVTPTLLQAALFVLPSRVDGMSNALLEAMALGMPCVATSVSGSVDLIDSGRNGILVPVENPRALASAIVGVLGKPTTQAQLGLEARRTIEGGYTTELMVRKYELLLTELAPSTSHPYTDHAAPLSQRA